MSEHTPTPATGAITRRAAFYLALASYGAIAVPAAAARPVAEAPHERVHRLAKELAGALGDPKWQGFKRATVTPERVAFDDDPATVQPAHTYDMESFALRRFKFLTDEHEQAEIDYLAAADLDDDAGMSAAFVATDAALMSICGYVPCSQYDAKAKRDYLVRWTEGCELEPRHVEALLGSMGRYQDTWRTANV